MLNTLPEHHLMEYLTSGHAYERMIHLLLPEWLQRLNVPPFFGIVSIEGWRGRWSSLGCCRGSCTLFSLCDLVRVYF